MKVTVLTDNISKDSLKSEWGLSFHIEFNSKSYLLDMGASDAFLRNAAALGISIPDVDCAVISHAHYDHTRGLEPFLRANERAKVHISANASENCYAGFYFLSHYIGLPKGVMDAYKERFVRHSSVSEIDEGVYLVPHDTQGLSKTGFRNHLFVRKGMFRYAPDDFSHEQSLVFKTDKGLVIFNSCSHSGPDVIISEVLRALPGERIRAYVGGLHLFRLTDNEISAFAERVAACGIDEIYTGHCTGQHPYEMLRERFGERISQFYCGMVMEFT